MTRKFPIHEGEPPNIDRYTKWIRLLVHSEATADDQEAEQLLREFAKALESSDYNTHEFALSVFRIDRRRAPSFVAFPAIENEAGCEGVGEVSRYLRMYTRDVKIPMVI